MFFFRSAYQIADYLQKAVNKNIGPELRATVKRGCSEYPISFPDYKEINKSGVQLMNYNEDWKVIEEEYDSTNSLAILLSSKNYKIIFNFSQASFNCFSPDPSINALIAA